MRLRRGRVGATYNIGGRNEWPNLDLARLLCARIDAAFAANPALATHFPDAVSFHQHQLRSVYAVSPEISIGPSILQSTAKRPL